MSEQERTSWDLKQLLQQMGERAKISPNFLISYSELRKLAIKWGERPVFLFPDDVSPPKEVRRDMNIREMLEYLGVTTELTSENVQRSYDVFENFRQLAYDGEIKVWGRPGSVNRPPSVRFKLIEEIPKAVWQNQLFIDGLRAVKEKDWRNIPTEAHHFGPNYTLYVDLYVSRAQIAANLQRLSRPIGEQTDSQSPQGIE